MVAPAVSTTATWMATEAERARLVRLCARLTGNADAAEDLAQETLIEAWRNAHKLSDPAGRMPWLAAIARNVCLRWLRRAGREAARTFLPSNATVTATALELLPDDFDIELELERSELAELLDRAMALLPPQTRAVLVERYVEQSPLAVVALQLGMTEGAVAMRIQRGKLQLRQVLSDELSREAATFDLNLTESTTLQTTNIWCPICGMRRLNGRFLSATGELLLRCPACTTEPDSAIVNGCEPDLLRGLHTLRPALNRLTSWANGHFQRALRDGSAPCPQCGRNLDVQRSRFPKQSPPFEHGLTLRCHACGSVGYSALCGIILCQPAPWRFWREHPRMRTTERITEFEGRAAVQISIESITGPERMDVFAASDTFEVLRIFGGSHAP